MATCLLTTVFTGFSSFGLAAVSTWFAFERVTYTRHKGKRWPADILADLNADIRKDIGIEWAENVLPQHADRLGRWGRIFVNKIMRISANIGKAGTRLFNTLSIQTNREAPHEDEDILPLPNQMSDAPVASPTRPALPHMPSGRTSRTESPCPTVRHLSPEPMIPTAKAVESPQASAIPQHLTGKGRFASAVRSVIMLRKASSSSLPVRAVRKMTGFSAVVGALENSPRATFSRRDSAEPFTAAKLSRIIMMSHSLKSVDSIETLPAHQALVRHLQFSPDGKWLATCSWDRTSVLFKVGIGVRCFFEHVNI